MDGAGVGYLVRRYADSTWDRTTHVRDGALPGLAAMCWRCQVSVLTTRSFPWGCLRVLKTCQWLLLGQAIQEKESEEEATVPLRSWAQKSHASFLRHPTDYTGQLYSTQG